nr:immunoglobulin light chain junction region [Macaca mulatta]MOV92497.1 immunoglobulin light chain junction region [Macaca mulatta]MOV92585.1 immunoglobulin light chain junction region [Macaca mulatta]MOV93220.1 immunoglobulin light chain junction region [Macaca mulatta]MOV93321.1 immunoglobulin light chain junction region [Macaca mulatta]
CQHYSGLPQSF